MKTKTWLALLSIYIIWGSTYLAILFVVTTIPPFISAGIRFLIAGWNPSHLEKAGSRSHAHPNTMALCSHCRIAADGWR